MVAVIIVAILIRTGRFTFTTIRNPTTANNNKDDNNKDNNNTNNNNDRGGLLRTRLPQ